MSIVSFAAPPIASWPQHTKGVGASAWVPHPVRQAAGLPLRLAQLLILLGVAPSHPKEASNIIKMN